MGQKTARKCQNEFFLISDKLWLSFKDKDVEVIFNFASNANSIFDAVMVCNGHYSVPNIPDVPNMDQFAGLRMHSHNYRTPDPFSNLRVVLLGAAASGTDIRWMNTYKQLSLFDLVFCNHFKLTRHFIETVKNL